MYVFKRVRINGRLGVVSRMLFVVAPNSLDKFKTNTKTYTFTYIYVYNAFELCVCVCVSALTGLRGGTYV